MKISRHIRYIDIEGADYCIRRDMRFDPPVEIESTIGASDPDIYKELDFTTVEADTAKGRTARIVNEASVLLVNEVMSAGEVLSVELRIGHRLKDIVLDSAHELRILAWDEGLLYWVTAGRDGVLEITGQVVPDDEGFFRKLKANLTDTAFRAYIVQRSLADTKVTLERVDRVPDVMTTEEAARYLGISKWTLYKKAGSGEIPRTRHKKFLKTDLDIYLRVSGRRRRR